MTSGRNQISPTWWKWVKDGWRKGEPHTGWGSPFVFEASSFIILSWQWRNERNEKPTAFFSDHGFGHCDFIGRG
jgi:hypothetical protein